MTTDLSRPRRALRFLGVGGIGFSVDAAVLMWLVHLGLSAYLSRALSLCASITLTWILNRHFSFGASGDRPTVEYGRYAAVALCAAAVNYGVYTSLVQHMAPVLAMVAGSAAAILLTYTGYDRWAFARRASSDIR